MVEAGPTTGMPMLDVFGDFVCPFCWLAQPVVERVSAALGLPVRHHAFELRPMPAPFPDERYMRRLWEHGVLPILRAQGIEATFPTIRTRTRKAHEAAAFADVRGRGAAMRAAIYDAYFRRGRDIGRIDEIVELGTSAGLNAADLRVALDNDQYAETIVEDRRLARTLEVPALPGFVLRAGGPVSSRVGWCAASDLRTWIEDNLRTVHA